MYSPLRRKSTLSFRKKNVSGQKPLPQRQTLPQTAVLEPSILGAKRYTTFSSITEIPVQGAFRSRTGEFCISDLDAGCFPPPSLPPVPFSERCFHAPCLANNQQSARLNHYIGDGIEPSKRELVLVKPQYLVLKFAVGFRQDQTSHPHLDDPSLGESTNAQGLIQ